MLRTCLTCGFETADEIAICPADKSVLKKTSKDPLIGTTFQEKYEITELLGKGGMGAVYKARHVLLDSWVAVKILRPELTDDSVSMQRFQREGKAVKLLKKHPNIMAVNDLGISNDGCPYMIMDYLEGKTLSAVIKAEGQLHPARVVFLFTQACDALTYAHNKGVIHRDIKPSNLMVEKDESEIEIIKIVDFGIAKLMELNTDSPQLTTTGEVFGSPYYMSPEQCSGKPTDARSDIYSLGCVIYECLTGIPPIRGETAIETICKHISDAPLPFAEIRPDLSIPKSLEQAVFKSLEKDPDRRYQKMTDLETDLQGAYPDGAAKWTSSFIKKTNLNVIPNHSNNPTSTVSSTSTPDTVTTKLCAECARPHQDSLPFCPNCGAPAQNNGGRGAVDAKRKCQKCGTVDEFNSVYCTECREKLDVQQVPALTARKRIPRIAIAFLSIPILLTIGFYAAQQQPQKSSAPDKHTVVSSAHPTESALPPTPKEQNALLELESCTLNGTAQSNPTFVWNSQGLLQLKCAFKAKDTCHIYWLHKVNENDPELKGGELSSGKIHSFDFKNPHGVEEHLILAARNEIDWLKPGKFTVDGLRSVFKKLSSPGMTDKSENSFAVAHSTPSHQKVSIVHMIARAQP